MNWALNLDLEGPGIKAVIMALANYADENHECFPGQELIARQTCQSTRTVQRHLARLVELGLLEKRARGGSGGGRWSNWYHLNVGRQYDKLSPSPQGNTTSVTGATRHLEQGYPPPVAEEPSLRTTTREPPPEENAEQSSAAPEALFDVPATKPGPQPDPANVAAKAIADWWHTRTNGMANWMAARAVVVKALKAGYSGDAIRRAMDTLYERRVPLSSTSLDIELRGGIGTTAKPAYKPYQDSDYWTRPREEPMSGTNGGGTPGGNAVR